MYTVNPAPNYVYAKLIEKPKKDVKKLKNGEVGEPEFEQYAEAVNVGSECSFVKEGDLIFVNVFAAKSISMDDARYCLVEEKEVIGSLVKE